MKNSFDFGKGEWLISWPGRVSRHDVVYLSPPADPMEGMPIGNGDVGALFWCEGSKLIIVLNKCDLWDDAAFGRFTSWRADEEDYSTTLRHGCRIVIDFHYPVFDHFYLTDFEGRISLADASISIKAKGPFGKVAIRGFVSKQDGLLCCKLSNGLKQSIPWDIRVERFGSRTFSHWYYLVNRDAKIGLKGTHAFCERGVVGVTHRLTSGEFAAGCSIASDSKIKSSCDKLGSNIARIQINDGRNGKLTLFAGVTSPTHGKSRELLVRQLSRAKKNGFADLFSEHRRAWKAFWHRSLMEFGDEYLDNLWHLTLFYTACSQGGTYPGRFINGLWGWNRDVQPWNFYYHWNQQTIYWPLNAAGHHDLVRKYLEWRFESLDKAKIDAKEMLGCEGAFVSDVTERRGYNSVGEIHNLTPVAQIALEFWRQYLYTSDVIFLRECALPYLQQACQLFESLFVKKSDGKYHAKANCGFEGWVEFLDSIAVISCGQALFSAAIKAYEQADISAPDLVTWKNIRDNMAELPMTKAGSEVIEPCGSRFALKRGMFKGDSTPFDKVLSAGYDIKQGKMVTTKVVDCEAHSEQLDPLEIIRRLEMGQTIPAGKNDMKRVVGIHWATEYSAIFPSGLIGISQKGTERFTAAVNTAKLYSPELLGWDPLPIILARLGCARELSIILDRWAQNWQIYPNGFGHWGTPTTMRADASLPLRTQKVEDATLSEIRDYSDVGRIERKGEFALRTWPFRHIAAESMSILACAMNESLLQSDDGVIRIAPAFSRSGIARFTLHAQGGFVVSAQIEKKKPEWVFLQSTEGGTFKLKNPWRKAFVYKNGKKEGAIGKTIIEWDSNPGDKFLLVPKESFGQEGEYQKIRYRKNQKPRFSKDGGAAHRFAQNVLGRSDSRLMKNVLTKPLSIDAVDGKDSLNLWR